MDMTKWKKLSALNVRNRRLEIGMTQAQVAKKVGCSIPALSRTESGAGKNLISLKTLLLLANALDVTPAALLEEPQ